MLFEIRWVNGQLQMSIWPEFVLFFIVPLFFVLEIFFVKIGLRLAKAQVRKGFKWVILSVFLQVGLFALVAMPFVLFAFMGMLSDFGAFAPYMFMLVFFAMFLDVCVINVFHQIGFKRSVGVFIIFLIGVFIIVGVAGTMISMSNNPVNTPTGIF